MPTLCLAQNPEADALLSRDAFALLVGMVLDQQFPLERAFAAPYLLDQRIGEFDARTIATYDEDALVRAFTGPPALHRFPGSMARRVQELARLLVDEYDGEPTNVWSDVDDGATLLRRVRTLPGFGEQKAKIFVALLGKQLGVRPSGWERAAGEYAEPGSFRSAADITDAATLAKVRAFKQERKRAAQPEQSG